MVGVVADQTRVETGVGYLLVLAVFAEGRAVIGTACEVALAGGLSVLAIAEVEVAPCRFHHCDLVRAVGQNGACLPALSVVVAVQQSPAHPRNLAWFTLLVLCRFWQVAMIVPRVVASSPGRCTPKPSKSWYLKAVRSSSIGISARAFLSSLLTPFRWIRTDFGSWVL